MIGRESVEVSHLMIEIEQLLEELSGSFLFDQGNRWPGNDSDRLSLVLHRPAKVIFANSTQAFKASGVAEAGAHQLQLEHRAQVYLSTESDQLKNEAKIGSLAEVFFCTRSLDLTPTQLSPNPAAPDRAWAIPPTAETAAAINATLTPIAANLIHSLPRVVGALVHLSNSVYASHGILPVSEIKMNFLAQKEIFYSNIKIIKIVIDFLILTGKCNIGTTIEIGLEGLKNCSSTPPCCRVARP